MTPDIINALFELGGAIMLSINVIQLYKDKKVSGVHWLPTLFFSLWGIWNIFFYSGLQQWYSFNAGIVLVCVNIIWFLQMIYYIRRIDV